jgi:hypothetical protein
MATGIPRHLREVRKFRPDLAKWKDAGYLKDLFRPLERILVAKMEKHHPTKQTATGERLSESQYLSVVQEFEILSEGTSDFLRDVAASRSSKERLEELYQSYEDWWIRINRMVDARRRKAG